MGLSFLINVFLLFPRIARTFLHIFSWLVFRRSTFHAPCSQSPRVTNRDPRFLPGRRARRPGVTDPAGEVSVFPPGPTERRPRDPVSTARGGGRAPPARPPGLRDARREGRSFTPGRGKCQGAFYKVHTPGRGVLAGAALSFPAALQRRDPAVESGLPRSTRDV